jgi:chaperonin GroES
MAKITFKPNEDRVLVEPAAAEQKTASGIIIPDTAKEKPQKGKVIAVGEGLKDKPVTVKVGDQILYGKYSVLRSPSKAKNTSSCATPTSSEQFNFFVYN